MIRLAYISSASPDLLEDDVAALALKAADFNSRHEITGLLLYNGLNFLQFLEGDETVVTDLFAAIVLDPRHDGVVKVLQEPIDARAFPDWGMRYSRVLCSALPTRTETLPPNIGQADLPDTVPGHLRRIAETFDTLSPA